LGVLVSVYYIVLFICGNYILLNVFLAIAVDNLADADSLTNAEKEEEQTELELDEAEEDYEDEKYDENGNEDVRIAGTEDDEDDLDPDGLVGARPRRMSQLPTLKQQKPIPKASSLFILSHTNPFRVFCNKIVNHSYFTNSVLVCILVSSAMLAAEDPLQAQSYRNTILNYFDYFFTTVFTVEITLKVVVYGLIFHKGSFCRNAFNLLDILVVAVSLISFVLKSDAISVVKILRVLRVLRPLKTIKRIPKLKAVFDCVVNYLKNVYNILIVYFLFQFIFAVIAVQLFKGTFFYCTDKTKRYANQCHGQYFVYDKQNEPPRVEWREWRLRPFNYDNTINAMLTLFVVTTGEGWPGIRQNSMDTTDVDQGPSPFFRVEVALFYVMFFIVFPFFFVNIFVALIIITFQEQGEAELSEGDLDKNQKQCIDFALNARPRSLFMPEHKNSIKYKIWQLVTSTIFEYFIMAMICMTTII
jgi:hypothetical protein